MMQKDRIFVDRRTGRPRLSWDDRCWHIYFTELKEQVPVVTNPAVRRLPVTRVHLQCGEDYKGETAYQSYCSYINDVLSAIRRGETDYCYYIYQIADLLRFEPELQTRLCCEDRLCPYFEVWLPGAPAEQKEDDTHES